MNRLELTAAAAFLLMLTQADAGSLNPPWMEPEVTPPSGACYPVISVRTGEVLYWTGSPAKDNCVFIHEDGPRTETVRTEQPEGPYCEPKERKTTAKKEKKQKQRPTFDNTGNDKPKGKAGEQDKDTGSSGGTRGASTGKH